MSPRIVLALTVLLGGCQSDLLREERPPQATTRPASAPRERTAPDPDLERRRYVEARPHLAPEVRAAILENRLVAGMTAPDVRAVLGRGVVVDKEPVLTDGHAHERWVVRRSRRAAPHCWLTFVDGELVTVQHQR